MKKSIILVVTACLVGLFSAVSYAGQSLPGKNEISKYLSYIMYEPSYGHPERPRVTVLSAERTNSKKDPMTGGLEVYFTAKIILPVDTQIWQGAHGFVFNVATKNRSDRHVVYYKKGTTGTVSGQMSFEEMEKGWQCSQYLFITHYQFNIK